MCIITPIFSGVKFIHCIYTHMTADYIIRVEYIEIVFYKSKRQNERVFRNSQKKKK
jgi:hypothetical protein